MMWNRYFFYIESPSIHLIASAERGALETEFMFTPPLDLNFYHCEISTKTFEEHNFPRPAIASVVLGRFDWEVNNNGSSWSAIFAVPFWFVFVLFSAILAVPFVGRKEMGAVDKSIPLRVD